MCFDHLGIKIDCIGVSVVANSYYKNITTIWAEDVIYIAAHRIPNTCYKVNGNLQ